MLESVPPEIWSHISGFMSRDEWRPVGLVNRFLHNACQALRVRACYRIPDNADPWEVVKFGRAVGEQLRKHANIVHVMFDGYGGHASVRINDVLWGMSLDVRSGKAALQHVSTLWCTALTIITRQHAVFTVFPGLAELHVDIWHGDITQTGYGDEDPAEGIALPQLCRLSLRSQTGSSMVLPQELSQVTALRLGSSIVWVNLLHASSALQCLELADAPIAISSDFAHLVELRLVNCNVAEIGGEELALPALRSLYMDNADFYESTTLAALLRGCTNKHFAVSGNAEATLIFRDVRQIADSVAEMEAVRVRGVDLRLNIDKLYEPEFVVPNEHISLVFGGPVFSYNSAAEVVEWWVRCCPSSVPLEFRAPCNFREIVPVIGRGLQAGLQQGQMAATYCYKNTSSDNYILSYNMPRGPVAVVGLCTGSHAADWAGLGVIEGGYTCWRCRHPKVSVWQSPV